MTKPLAEIIAEIKQRAESATPGPWHVDIRNGDLVICGNNHLKTIIKSVPSVTLNENDDFIAHSRTDIPRLLAALEKAIKQRDCWMENEGAKDNDYKVWNEELAQILRGKT